MNTPLIQTIHLLMDKLKANELQDHILITKLEDESTIDILLATLNVFEMNKDVKINDVTLFLNEFIKHIEPDLLTFNHQGWMHHPLQLMKEENELFRAQLNHLNPLVDLDLVKGQLSNELNGLIKEIKRFNAHYNRKEKLFFPILERYQVNSLTRTMWRMDDDVRAYFKALENRSVRIGELESRHIEMSKNQFIEAFQNMLDFEHYLLFPIVNQLFTIEDFKAIDAESEAFGYAVHVDKSQHISKKEQLDHSEQHKIGQGYLTLKEVDLILDNIPLELTFVDRNGLFKYFNDIVESKDMMFIRTPISIGRHVANCHPPKSMGKVMQIIRQLESKQKEKEHMWFKKGDEFIFVTYKGVFDDDGEFMGVLEYVQDIQPFFELDGPIKKHITPVDEKNAIYN